MFHRGGRLSRMLLESSRITSPAAFWCVICAILLAGCLAANLNTNLPL